MMLGINDEIEEMGFFFWLVGGRGLGLGVRKKKRGYEEGGMARE